MSLMLKGKSSRPELYRGRGMPVRAVAQSTIDEVVTPRHPNRSKQSGGLVLRAGWKPTREKIVYFEAVGDRKSASDAWEHHRDANDEEHRIIRMLIADEALVEKETSFGILLFRKSEMESG